MLHGAILPGEDRFSETRWHNDVLEECYNDDALWGYVVRVGEELRLRNLGDWTDPVLYRLFRMGVDDWTKLDHRTNVAIQATRFTTAMASCLTCRIMEGEDRVCPSRF